jgi:outer membrane protein assembly factor BamA
MNMMPCEGSINILQESKIGQILSFKTLRSITNPRTGRKYSSSIISKRLKELVETGALEETPTTSQKGRKIAGYRITDGDYLLILLTINSLRWP